MFKLVLDLPIDDAQCRVCRRPWAHRRWAWLDMHSMQEVHRQPEIERHSETSQTVETVQLCAVMFAGQYPGYGAGAYGYSDPYGRPPTKCVFQCRSKLSCWKLRAIFRGHMAPWASRCRQVEFCREFCGRFCHYLPLFISPQRVTKGWLDVTGALWNLWNRRLWLHAGRHPTASTADGPSRSSATTCCLVKSATNKTWNILTRWLHGDSTVTPHSNNVKHNKHINENEHTMNILWTCWVLHA